MPPHTSARVLPRHTHKEPSYPAANCPGCMENGSVNPDTGTRWPSLDDHGDTVVAEAVARFHDRYDGPGTEERALETAVQEAYLRGRMQGRLEEARDAAKMADASLRNAAEHLEKARAAATAGDVAGASSHATLAHWHTSAAATYRAVAGSRA